jgi:hypothetical protein
VKIALPTITIGLRAPRERRGELTRSGSRAARGDRRVIQFPSVGIRADSKAVGSKAWEARQDNGKQIKLAPSLTRQQTFRRAPDAALEAE